VKRSWSWIILHFSNSLNFIYIYIHIHIIFFFTSDSCYDLPPIKKQWDTEAFHFFHANSPCSQFCFQGNYDFISPHLSKPRFIFMMFECLLICLDTSRFKLFSRYINIYVLYICVSSSKDVERCLIPLHHRCQTQGPRAECGPPRHFMRPLAAWKTHDHL